MELICPDVDGANVMSGVHGELQVLIKEHTQKTIISFLVSFFATFLV